MKFGIAGLGNHAINRVMPAIAATGNQITSIYSRSIDKARKEGMKYNSKSFDNLDTMFENGDFDAIYIASPNFLHYPQTKKALNHGKHVLLEKQMTLKSEEARELVDLAAEKGLKLAIGFHMRFNPAIPDVKKMLASGDLGDIAYVSGMWAHQSARSYEHPDNKWWAEDNKVGGGSVMGTGVHVLDTLNYIMGAVPDRVCSFRNPAGQVIETTEHITLQYSGTIADVISSRAISGKSNHLSIHGTKGTLTVTNVFSTSVEASMILDGKKVKDYRGVNVYEEEVRGFVNLVQGTDSRIATGEDGYNVVRIVESAFESDSKPDLHQLNH